MEIWKFPIPERAFGSVFAEIKMPSGAEILCVQMQNGEPMIWATVNPEADREERLFTVIGTGQEFAGTSMKYIGTYQKNWFVGHVFELT